nr:hypothetical protein [Nocardia terpenica]
MGCEALGGGVGQVAERASPTFPQAFGRFAFHAVDDAIDDGVAFELGEHAEHLDQHAAHGGGGVERFGRGPEYHAALVEVIEQAHHVAQVAGESVDPVHQQHIDQSRAGGAHGALQLVAVGGRAGGIVGEPHHDVPTRLGVHIRFQARVLGFDRVGLVFVVGGTAHVDPDPHRVEGIQPGRLNARGAGLAFPGSCHRGELLSPLRSVNCSRPGPGSQWPVAALVPNSVISGFPGFSFPRRFHCPIHRGVDARVYRR